MNLIRSMWVNPRYRYGSLALALAVLPLLPSNTVGGMVAAVARNATGLLDARSPGGRDAGALYQTKLARHRAAPTPRGPQSRVLSETRSRPAGFAPSTLGEPGGDLLPIGLGPLYGPDALGGELGHFGDLPIGGGPLLLFDTVPTPDEPAPAVPEPGTYVLLILGFGMIGAAQRRRRGKAGAVVAPQGKRIADA